MAARGGTVELVRTLGTRRLLALAPVVAACRDEYVVLDLDGGGVGVAACGLTTGEATPEVEVAINRDSAWETGACYTITVTNAVDEAVIWEVELRAGGEVYDVWNTLPEGEGPLQRYRGDPAANNVSLNAGGATSFGLCMECTPASE